MCPLSRGLFRWTVWLACWFAGGRGPNCQSSSRPIFTSFAPSVAAARRRSGRKARAPADGAIHTCTFDHYRLAGRAMVRIHTGGGRDARTGLYRDRRQYV